MRAGRLRVDGEAVPADFAVPDNALITHVAHRHELGIADAELDIVHDDADFLVVNKPASWPVHPTGRFNFNSTTAILHNRYGYKGLRSECCFTSTLC